MKTPSAIRGFTHDYFYLSNFFPCEIPYEGLTFHSTENAFHAAKYPLETRVFFVTCTPCEAKKHGRSPMEPAALREWDAGRKLRVMLELNLTKFITHTYLRDRLLNTGNSYLEETNDWGDTYWGVMDGKGLNMLGHILMTVRAYIRSIWMPLAPGGMKFPNADILTDLASKLQHTIPADGDRFENGE